MMYPLFEKEFTVHYHDLDMHGKVRPVTLLNYLQDAAGLHATQLGVSVADLRTRGLTWVISRIHLLIERYPRRGEAVMVRTWPSTRQGMFTCREFELLDSTPIGRATTSWALIDLRTRRPVRLEGNLPPYPLLEQRALPDDFSTLPPMPEPATAELQFRVLRGDLDTNRHVNNTVFAGWALETVSDEIAAGVLTELEISFRAEVLYGETIISRCAVVTQGPQPCCLHRIVRMGDEQELARLRTRWTSG